MKAVPAVLAGTSFFLAVAWTANVVLAVGRASGLGPPLSTGTAVSIQVPKELRLLRDFGRSGYYGVVVTQRELDDLWSELGYPGRLLLRRFGVPDPPLVDFSTHRVLWFADRGAHGSFVKSLHLEPDDTPGVLKAIVTVYHSDFLSRRLNLWRIPKAPNRIVIEVQHEYERPPGP